MVQIILDITDLHPYTICMIIRQLEAHVKQLASWYPVVTITGPRQSGKTTLARTCFPDLPYRNLERLDERSFAREDPVGFLNQFPEGAVLDEVQHVPELSSYLQVLVDERKKNGQFILTGSGHFNLLETVSQSLAGRTGMVRLLPFSLQEIHEAYPSLGKGINDYIFRGFYPRLYEEGIDPAVGLAEYIETYIERDVRQLTGVKDLLLFRTFVGLCAGRTGQLLNYANLADDVGISPKTAAEWISLLESSFILFRLPPYFRNMTKRLVKSPKLYFCDVGLAAHLLGIENSSQIATHPLRGQLFENLVVSEVLKHRYNSGKRENLTFFRDAKGHEVDLLYQSGSTQIPIEIKSGATVRSEFFKGLQYFNDNIEPSEKRIVVYGGERNETRTAGIVTNVFSVAEYLRNN